MEAVGEDLDETRGNIIAKSYKILRDKKPDALLILGDTNSALSVVVKIIQSYTGIVNRMVWRK